MRSGHLLVFVVLFWSHTFSLDIETARKEACAEDTILDAIVENIRNRTLAYVFSGQNVWTLDIQEGKLTEVNRAGRVFSNIAEHIVAGAADNFEEILYLIGRNAGYEVHSNRTKTYDYRGIMEQLQYIYNFKAEPQPFICMANYRVSPYEGRVFFQFKDESSYECYRSFEERNKPSRKSCQATKGAIWNPNGVPEKALKNCKGLMIDEGPVDWEIPNKTVTVDKTVLDSSPQINSSRYRMLFADTETLYYWNGKKLMYTRSLGELFGCHSQYLTIIIAAVVIGVFLILLISGVAVIILTGMSEKGEDEEVSKSTKRTMYTQRTANKEISKTITKNTKMF